MLALFSTLGNSLELAHKLVKKLECCLSIFNSIVIERTNNDEQVSLSIRPINVLPLKNKAIL